jgi:FKBP-type peptidyl-prolyl cis-trans isomerase FkpA/FKBP-type peptidyl-prolyl cis-trans isomerase FklB
MAAIGAARAEAPAQTEEEKTIYALGQIINRNLQSFALTDAELKIVQQGMTDGAHGVNTPADLEQYGAKIKDFERSRLGLAAAKEKEAGKTFLQKAASEKGAKKTATGLIITTTKAGTGDTPKPTDKVKVNYEGKLTDGSIFDSSIQRGQPATFPLNGVIACWTEGLQLMKVGGKSRLVCPSDIAYGDRGSPPKIKPGSTLVFDVELLEIVK